MRGIIFFPRKYKQMHIVKIKINLLVENTLNIWNILLLSASIACKYRLNTHSVSLCIIKGCVIKLHALDL